MFTNRTASFTNFEDSNVLLDIRKHIKSLNLEIRKLQLFDAVFVGGVTPISWYIPMVGIPALVVYPWLVRSYYKNCIGRELDVLGRFFIQVRPNDTAKPIVIELTHALAPLIADDEVLTQWMLSSANAAAAIDQSHIYFTSILKKRGFLEASSFDDLEEAYKARKQKEIEIHTNAEVIFTLLKKKIYFALYGNGSLLHFFDKNISYFYFSRSPDIREVVSDNNISLQLPEYKIPLSFHI